MYERVLVPTDGSDAAASALDHAMTIASDRDATVHVLYVADRRVSRGAPALGVDEVERILLDDGERATGALAERAREAGIEVETAIREGVPDDEILAYADEQAIDIVVMGATGKDHRERLRVGSVTNDVVNAGTVPVLTVPSDRPRNRSH